jgi:hypothetical protein
MKEFVIYFKDSAQISPDDWTVFNAMKKFDETTTLKEIKEWASKGNDIMPQLTINEV